MEQTEEAAAATEGQGGSQGTEPTVDSTVDTEASVIEDVDATTKGGESQEQTPDQFDWTTFKNADRYQGRTVQELIDYANQRDYQYGQQSNELGDARRYKAELEALRRQVAGQKPTEEKRKFSDVEQAIFAQKLQNDPLGAIHELGPDMAKSIAQQVLGEVRKDIRPTIQAHAQDVADQQEADNLYRNHPELRGDDELLGMTRALMSPNYLGDNARYEEAYLLAKLTKSNASLFPTTCYLMRMGMPFKEAKDYASLKKNSAANAQTTKEQIKDEITGISGGTKRTATKQGTSEPEIKDMDDAFAP